MVEREDARAAVEPQRIVASEITLVDRRGRPRIRMVADEDGTAAVKFYDTDDQLRMALYLKEPEADDETDGVDNADLIIAECAEAGLIMTERFAGSIRLGIYNDGLFGRRPHLEIAQGAGTTKRVHLFPSRPPYVDD